MKIWKWMVVALIVGILVGIAVTQYRVSITRTPNQEVVAALRSIGEGLKKYYVKHGSMPESVTNRFAILGIQPPFSTHWEYDYGCSTQDAYCSIFATPKREYAEHVKYYTFTLSVMADEMQPYISVLESEITSRKMEGNTTYTNAVSKSAGPEVCKQAGGLMDEKYGCILKI